MTFTQDYGLAVPHRKSLGVLMADIEGLREDLDLSFMGLEPEETAKRVANIRLYADSVSRNNILTSHGLVYRGSVNLLSNVTEITTNDVIYLGTLNNKGGIIAGHYYYWNTSNLSILADLNIIYTNAFSSIYRG